MEINVRKDYNQINVTNRRNVDDLIKRIIENGLGNDNWINLDLTHCQTDYPQTPRLIDFLLNHLSLLENKKVLKIIFDGLGVNELYILHDIILEGEFFGIHTKINSPEEVSLWVKIINEKLNENRIRMEILYLTENKTYIYGE